MDDASFLMISGIVAMVILIAYVFYSITRYKISLRELRSEYSNYKKQSNFKKEVDSYFASSVDSYLVDRDAGLPLELCSAHLRYNNLLSSLRDEKANRVTSELLIADAPYPSEGNVEGITCSVKSPGFKHFSSLRKRLNNVIKKEAAAPNEINFESSREKEYFDLQKRPELPYFYPMITSFLFFLVFDRYRSWGVIPIGDHRRVGLYCSKASPVYQAIREHRCFEKVENDCFGKGYYAFEENNAVEVVYRVCNKKNLIINALEGYIYSEILPLSLIEIEKDSPEVSLNKRNRIGNIVSLEYNKYERRLMSKMSEKEIYIGDLSHRFLLNDDNVVIALNHNNIIPVGVGFSLLAYPMVVKNGMWREIAYALTFCDKELFKLNGVDLDQKLLDQYQSFKKKGDT